MFNSLRLAELSLIGSTYPHIYHGLQDSHVQVDGSPAETGNMQFNAKADAAIAEKAWQSFVLTVQRRVSSKIGKIYP